MDLRPVFKLRVLGVWDTSKYQRVYKWNGIYFRHNAIC